MSKVIILEGIDGSGKSTLAAEFEKSIKLRQPNANVIRAHRGPMIGSVEDEYLRPIYDLEENDVLIADRWHVGEMIYGPIYRGHSQIRSVIGEVETFLDLYKAIRIIMSPSISVVEQRLQDRGEDYLLPHHVAEVHEFYEAFASVFKYKKIANWDQSFIDEILDQLFEEKTEC
jgi:thymidylate kinase